MRNVSKKYIETMETRRDFYAVGEITFADGTQKTLSKEDFSLTGNSVIDSAGSTSFPLGMLIPKQIKVSLMNDDDRWSEYDFYGASIYLQTKFDLDDGTTESLNIGTFTVIAPETYGTTVEVTAMDDSYKTDKPYDTQNDYPMSVGVALRDCCSTCDILLGTSSFPNSDYVIPSKPENLTHRQFIGLCAQIAGGNARFDEYNRLEIITYDFSPLESNIIDGGTFEPWTEGENYDGGTFSPWTAGTTIDGGTFGDRDNIHVLYQFKSGIAIEVDDVVITGVQMEGEDAEGNKTTHLYGKEGYVLSLENQLATGKEEEVLRRIGESIVGIRFRPFSGDHIALPTAEFMDLAYIVDRKQNVYNTVLTDVTFNYFGYTNLKCTADSPLRNSSTRMSNEVKAIVEARKMVERERSEREKAVQNLQEALAKGSGMYPSEEVQPDGSRIYYLHDKPTREESQVVIKLNSEGIGISQDGGDSYPWGITFTGTAILEMIYAIGLNADYITTGAFEIRRDGKIMVLMDKDTGQVILRPDTFELSSGDTIGSIAQDAVDEFVNGSYKDTIDELKKQADQKAETWYQSTNPANSWTSTERAEHKGDLWYDTSNSKVYIYSGSSWVESKTEVPQDVFDKIDGKAQIFTSTPTVPYHKGDLWFGGTSSDIKVCTYTRTSGSYYSGDWQKRDRYIDSSTASSAASSAASTAVNNAMTQQNIFNKLTGGGANQGIYLENGRIYVNASYIKSGTISADLIDTSNIIAGQVNSTNGSYWCKIVNGRMSGGYDYSSENGYLDLTSNTYMNDKPLYPVVLRAYYNMVLWATNDIRLFSETGSVLIYRSTVAAGWKHILGTVDGLDGKRYIDYMYLASNFIGLYDASGNNYFIDITTSDAKQKSNIWETTESALDVINAIGHCSFDRDGQHYGCGYIAQQLQEIKPEFVKAAKNLGENGQEVSYTLHVNSFEILGYATKAIQELSEENEALKSRITSLEERLEALERRFG